tara:strand:- start:1426 stop:1971 length:546 start_codon:yes stop_codon:yes gene_type:complete
MELIPMAVPDKIQQERLVFLKKFVLNIMQDMEIWQDFDLEELSKIKLGVLKRNATQRHGATKWQLSANKDLLTINDVEVIELHPHLLEEKWNAYAAYVLHHEFIHALGFRNHDSLFRKLENSWPGSSAAKLGPIFTEEMRLSRAKWLWQCNSCSRQFPRQKPSNGRYQCRECQITLIDIKV